jgi:choline dehydrogenase-like flavoprotein
MSEDITIIGSGPAGIAAAHALLARGARVQLLDGGLGLEADRQQVLDRTSVQTSDEWSADDIRLFKGEMQATAAGIPEKLSYGSSFPYQETGPIYEKHDEVGLSPSLARGGFSSVWGAAMLPYLPEDTRDWAVPIEELAPHYRASIGITGLAGRRDALDEKFPLHGEPHQKLPESRHVGSFLGDMERNSEALKNAGVLFGRSRLAVAAENEHGYSCWACRMCLYGCPSNLIFNTAFRLPDLQKNPLFSYRSGVVAESFSETADGVEVRARDRATGKAVTFHTRRLLVGAGVLSTARLVLESLGAYGEEVVLKDSQYFLLPLLRFAGTPGAENEAQHTLSQAFVEILDPATCDKSIHLQVYGYNELYRQAIDHKLRALHKVAGLGVTQFLRRFLLIQGYLHSDYSHAIRVRLPKSENGLGQLQLDVERNPQTDAAIRKMVRKLASLKGLLRAVPLEPLLQKGTIGRGYHTGGSFPMRQDPQGRFETDTLGRLSAWQNVHLIDASVFPSVPASTITLTAMANAHRIASHIEL